MATATTSSTDPNPGKERDKDKDETVGKVPSEGSGLVKAPKDVKLDEHVFKFGPTKIQTAEDAAVAYLREEISEDEFRAACSKYGVLPGTLLYTKVGNDRLDAAFKREIPEDIYNPGTAPDVNIDDRLKAVEERDKEREKATKENEDKTKDVQPVKIVQG